MLSLKQIRNLLIGILAGFTLLFMSAFAMLVHVADSKTDAEVHSYFWEDVE